MLGVKTIASLDESSVNARAADLVYEDERDAELRAHDWNFAITRASIAADGTEPIFTKTNYFSLPANCLRVLPPDPEDNFNSRDWQVEGRKIATNEDSPLELRYVKQVTDPNEMDALFRKALSARIALQLCEKLTQSNVKKRDLAAIYEATIREARKANAFENVAKKPPDDEWITVRS